MDINWPQFFAGLAGAVAGLCDRWLKKRPKSFLEAIITGIMEVFVGVFAGYVMGSLVVFLGKPDLSHMAWAFGGWGGGKTIELSRKAMNRALGITEDKK